MQEKRKAKRVSKKEDEYDDEDLHAYENQLGEQLPGNQKSPEASH